MNILTKSHGEHLPPPSFLFGTGPSSTTTTPLSSKNVAAAITSSLSAEVGSIADFFLQHSTAANNLHVSIVEQNQEQEDETNYVPALPSIKNTQEQHTEQSPVISPNREQLSDDDLDNLNDLNTSGNKEKLGHRRVDEAGNVTYKKCSTDELMKSLQIGLTYALGKHHQPQRQVLLQDFQQIEYVDFPHEGSNVTPSHSYPDFRLKTYAQTAFRFFRNAFGVEPSSFMVSLCSNEFYELPNAGASGSIFYTTSDDLYIIKTVSKKEARFLLSLLPGYYMNLTQNPFTLLPKFFGLYCYQSSNKNIRFVIMNNLVPSSVYIHEKYDLKGSIYKRKASEFERQKPIPTYKDNDWKEKHKHGIILEPFFYDQLIQTIHEDVRVLGSFQIMDYSLLLAIHNITEHMQQSQNNNRSKTNTLELPSPPCLPLSSIDYNAHPQLPHLPTYIQYLRVIEFIRQQDPTTPTQHDSSDTGEIEIKVQNQPSPPPPPDTISIKTIKPLWTNNNNNNEDVNINTISAIALRATSASPTNFDRTSSATTNGISTPFHLPNASSTDSWFNKQNLSRLAMAGIPAVNEKGDLLLLYVGIIDILQNYRLRKKLEHAFKSTLVTKEEVSVCNPSHYGSRFVRFFSRSVFRKGGASGSTIMSDSQSNMDQVTLHSSRFLNPSSVRSCMSETSSNTNDFNSMRSQ